MGVRTASLLGGVMLAAALLLLLRARYAARRSGGHSTATLIQGGLGGILCGLAIAVPLAAAAAGDG